MHLDNEENELNIERYTERVTSETDSLEDINPFESPGINAKARQSTRKSDYKARVVSKRFDSIDSNPFLDSFVESEKVPMPKIDEVAED